MSKQTIRIGQKWRSKDPRDDGRIATVIHVDHRSSVGGNGIVTIQRLRKSEIRADNLRKTYELMEEQQ